MGVMSTVYIRDVPDDVVAVLKERARREGQSLSAYVNAALARLAAHSANEQVVERLRARPRPASVGTEEILSARDEARR